MEIQLLKQVALHKVISSEKGNSELTPSIKINDMNLQNDKLKLSITGVDFLGNLSSSRKSEGLVVLNYYGK
ncbi:hypothetical protein [Enterococcus faecalis]|uniref:hypothetical protein n=1 Tax=Enterococcus faecalis TaxID=1351 RepID=UPI001F616322|nr:hypothetical protein [Enterococcus faecalis]UNT41211.1 hypothetical protein MPM64_05670 [Enterococcus faecalis]